MLTAMYFFILKSDVPINSFYINKHMFCNTEITNFQKNIMIRIIIKASKYDRLFKKKKSFKLKIKYFK